MADENSLVVQIQGDASGLEEAAKKASESLGGISKGLAETAANSAKAGGSLEQFAGKASEHLKKVTASTYIARDAVLDLGHVARDLPYAANNIAVLAGPIGKIGSLLNTLKDQTGSVKGAFVALGGALSGGGGLVILGELAVSAFALLSSSFSSTGKAANEFLIKMKFVNDELATTAADVASKSVSNILKLNAVLVDSAIPLKQRTEALADYNKVSDKQNRLAETDLSNISKINDAISNQINLFKERALVKGAEDQIASLYKLVFGNEFKISDAADKFHKVFDITQLVNQGGASVKDFTNDIYKLKDASNTLGKAQVFFSDAQKSDAQKKIGDLFAFIQRTVKEGSVFGDVLGLDKDPKLKAIKLPKIDMEGRVKKIEYDAPNVDLQKQLASDLDLTTAFHFKPDKEVESLFKAQLEGLAKDIKPIVVPVAPFPIEGFIKTMQEGDLGNFAAKIGAKLGPGFDTAFRKIFANSIKNAVAAGLNDQQLASFEQKIETIGKVGETAANGIANAFAAIPGALASGQSAFAAFGNALKQTFVSILSELIKTIVLTSILKAITGGGAAGAQGLSSAVAGGFNPGFGLTGFATGGLVTGPVSALIGEGTGTSKSNPEVVAPLDQLKKLLGGNGIGNNNSGGFVRFEIEGKSLVGVLSKESRSQNRNF